MTPIGLSNRSAGKTRPHVVAVPGSRRDGSYTRRALEEALDASEAAGGTAELLDLANLQLPPLDPSTDPPEDSETVRRTIREADAVILGTPLYHGSYSGVLKNALDYCGFDEFEDTTVGLLVVSGGAFPTPALDHLRAVCRSLNAWVLPHQAAVPRARSAFDESGFTDDDLRDRVRTLGTRAVEFATIEPGRAPPIVCQEV
ncbi:NADPH-dependent FMN reductase [Natronosalvus rutilus]|uniref:NAD(P)H-dependent oxidoreductase n=1 Tax=Natronosalvus rutilus TaxID=2953753 RepID=A0A9E7NEZ2_9EURY|nr:NADPH-dependent FMN reductase [Natronosalvus rutilus]UTF55775.1 NAD(P)H-dependent oxidoreductase [Natronosalvus rutilus]